MNYQQATKYFAKESMIAGGIVGLLAAVVFGLSTVDSDFMQSNTKLQNDVNKIANETSALQTAFTKAQQQIGIYQEAMRVSKERGYAIDRQALTMAFNSFSDKYFLSGVRLSMGGLDDMKDAKYVRKTNKMVSRTVNVNFSALSDEYVFGVLNDMPKTMAGSTRMTRMVLTRQSEVNDSILRQITQKGAYPLMNGELQFTWIGIQPVDANDVSLKATKDK